MRDNNLYNLKNMSIIKNAFREYYFKSSKIEIPSKIESREFGFNTIEHGIVRHFSFANKGELIARIIKETPLDIFCSNAFYDNPELPMNDKAWKGAELIFDIDSKDLALDCMEKHTYYKCKNCNEVSNKSLTTCVNCNTNNFTSIIIPCDNCINGLVKELEKLLDFMKNDFGIDPKDIKIYFSGNAGFHVHINDERYFLLSSRGRSDIVGYLLGNGFMIETLGINKIKNKINVKINKESFRYGWRKRLDYKLRIANNIDSFIKKIQKPEEFEKFKGEVDSTIQSFSVKIDAQVTTDIHRIFRLAGTINSKSGLIKTICTDIRSFDPFDEACLINDKEIEVYLLDNVKFKLKHQTFKLKKENNKIPLYAAVYVICKGIAYIP